MERLVQIRGRGAGSNPANRFDRIHVEVDDDAREGELSRATEFFRDTTRRVIANNDSPDVGFTYSLNPYRGCEHGCAYCFARPFHEYLGFSSGMDFESRIMVKHDAPDLLRSELGAKRWGGAPIAMSGVTDPYQPVERRMRITRGCLEVLVEFRNPVAIVTKNHLVTRDVDLLADLARDGAAAVFLSVTTLDAELQREMEPRASTPSKRLDAIRQLSAAGVSVGVLVAPVVPGLTDHEMPSILEAAAAAGATTAGYIPLRLPHSVKAIFDEWLSTHRPERRDRVLNRVREIRGGELYDSTWNKRMRGEGEYADHIASLFRVSAARNGLNTGRLALSSAAFRKPAGGGEGGGRNVRRSTRPEERSDGQLGLGL